MAFGKKKKQAPQSVQQYSGVKVDKANNPFYPQRKESLVKEIGTTLGVVVVCLLLTGVIVTNFNYMAIASRQDAKQDSVLNTQEADTEEVVQNGQSDAEIDVNVSEEYVPENPGIDQPGKVIDEAVPTPTPILETANDDYIIPDSNTRYITDTDLENLTQEKLRIARNEIYARHGRLFKDETLQAYFDSKDWYTGTIPPDNFTQEMLNDVERANTAVISDFETRKGY